MISTNAKGWLSFSAPGRADSWSLEVGCVLFLLIGALLWIRWNQFSRNYSPQWPSNREDSEVRAGRPSVAIGVDLWRSWYEAASALDSPIRSAGNRVFVVSTVALAVPGLLLLNTGLKLSVLIYAPILAYYLQQSVTDVYRKRKFATTANEMRNWLVPELLGKVGDKELFVLALNASVFVGPVEIRATTAGAKVVLETNELARWRRGPIWYQG